MEPVDLVDAGGPDRLPVHFEHPEDVRRGLAELLEEAVLLQSADREAPEQVPSDVEIAEPLDEALGVGIVGRAKRHRLSREHRTVHLRA